MDPPEMEFMNIGNFQPHLLESADRTANVRPVGKDG